MPNRLANEKSLYLRQHADNPVDWHPWGEEAWAKARAEDKPVIVSIGYSACHWCHVMERESFEDEYIAGLMNKHFVCIKVDREERPDVDQIYMEAVQMMMGHGGWPLNAFCLPDGRPFAGGTYFPPDDSRGQGAIPWPQLLMRIADYYKRNRGELAGNADALVKNLVAANDPVAPKTQGAELDKQAVLFAASMIMGQHDDEHGGFGRAPKFPPSMSLDFLMALRSSATVEERNPDFAARADGVITKTLDAMALGGLYDQIGGGFARYSVDEQWRIPHFEKMLYDNALLLKAYTKGWLRYRKPLYAAIVEETIGWLQREMLMQDGGFASALDADSEGEEGKYYVWTPAEVKAVLGDDAGNLFCDAYSITAEGNFEHGRSNPLLAGEDLALRERLAPMRAQLLQARQQRIRPGRDDKRLTAWNALMASSLATAGFCFGREDWFGLARDTVAFLAEKLLTAENRLHAAYSADEARSNGYLDDYAFLAEALLTLAGTADWLEPGAGTAYLEQAKSLTDMVLRHFDDPEEGQPGYFFTSDDHEQLVARKKSWYDNAIPAGNSAMVHVFAGLHALTGEEKYRHGIEHLRAGYPGLAERAPSAASHALSGFTADFLGIAVVKAKDVAIAPLREALAGRPWRQVFVVATEAPGQPAGYQLCVGTVCLQPTTDPAEIAQRL